MKTIFDSQYLTISSAVKSTPKIDGVFFAKIKDFAIGKNFEVSLTFIGDKKMRALNKKFRGKDYVTDVLSFPIENNTNHNSGEIFINLNKTKSKAKEFEKTFKNYLEFLYVHSLIHLTGLDHGPEMDKIEDKIRKKFGI